MKGNIFDNHFFFVGPFIFPRFVTCEIIFWSTIILFVCLTLLAKVSPFFQAIHSKVLLYIDGLIQMVATKDSQWKQPVDWTSAGIEKIGSKRIVFIRHGESAWNEVFNRGFNLGFPGRLIRGLIQELSYIATRFSIFFDTPLNDLGIHQAQELARFLDKGVTSDSQAVSDVISVLRGESTDNSLIVSSNLRRAIETVAIGLWGRLDKTKEKIYIHSCLQEISRNVDCVASAPPGGIPEMSGPDCLNAADLMKHGSTYDADAIFDASLNAGQKPLNERGVERLEYFAQWVFTRPEDTIIAGGHSLWFRNFFKAFLASSDTHPGKSCKMKNGACVAFTLNMGKTDNGYVQWIEPNSIVTILGGFEEPKSKKVKTM